VLVKAESVLGLVHEALLGATVDSLVLGAAELVMDLLGVGLARVGLGTASDLVGSAGEGLLGLVEGGLGGVGGLDGVVSMKWRRSGGKEGDEPSSPQPWCGNLCGMPQTC
jgi:hypothetical protein